MEVISAAVVSVDVTGGVRTLGFTESHDGEGRYLILQKRSSDSSVYFEMDDQINSAYDAIGGYSTGAGRIELQLKKPVGRLSGTVVVVEFPEEEESTVVSEIKGMLG